MTAAVEYRESVDFERVDALIAWAEVEDGKRRAGLPSEWDQSDWNRVDPRLACGTVCCIAGKVALDDDVLLPEKYARVSVLVGFGGDSISEYAQAVLGLPETSADTCGQPVLFAGGNDLADLKRIRDEYAVMEGVPTRYEVAS